MKVNDTLVAQLSAHLFWDIDPAHLDKDRSRRTIIKRVLDYGLWQDWLMIEKYYGLPLITAEAQAIRELDPKSLAFISRLSGVAKENFKCYTTKQLTPVHWNF